MKNSKNEIWKIIDGFGDYHISNFGRIKSFKWGKEKILIPSKNRSGYLYIRLYKSKKRYSKKIHRILFENFIRKLLQNEIVHHIDGNPINNDYINNLIPIDKIKHDSFHNKGENNPKSVLTEKNIIEIRKLCDKGILTQTEIGKIFRVSKSTISKIKNKKHWNTLKHKI